MPLSFKYTTTAADYALFDQATINYLTAGDVNRNQQFSDQIYGMIFVIVFLVMVAIITAVLKVSFSIFSFALGIVFYIFITRYKVKRIKTQVTPRPDSSLFCEQEMVLDEDAFTINTPTSSTKTSWAVVSAVQENDSYFFIFLDSLRGFYIPKRDLVSEDLVKEVRMNLNAKVKQ